MPSSTAEVFESYDLVALIVPYLDSLSLIRSQGINSTFRNVIRASSRLQQQSGFISVTEGVLDNPSTPYQIKRSGRGIPVTYYERRWVFWNPMLDWFSLRCFGLESDHAGLFTYSANSSSITLIMLPHALRAAQNPDSSIHRMFLTENPISCVMLRIMTDASAASRTTQTVKISNPNGVTLGEVLKQWACLAGPNTHGLPIGIWVPWQATSQSEARESEPEKETRETMEFECDYALRTLHGDLSQAQCRDWCYSYVVSEHVLDKEWFERTVADGKSWYNTPMNEQSAYVLNILKRQALVMAPGMRSHRNYCTRAWPALALKDGQGTKSRELERTYRVVCAGGLVFNRWTFDAGGVPLPCSAHTEELKDC